MFDDRLTRFGGALLVVLASACGAETKTENKPPLIDPLPVVPTVLSFEAEPEAIEAGTPTMLHWATTDVDAIERRGDDGTVIPVDGLDVADGSVAVEPGRTTTYTLTATTVGAEGGPAWRNLTVTVHEAPIEPPVIVAFTATPDTVAVGDEAVLAWRTTGATAVTVKDDAGVVVTPDDAPVAEGQVTVKPGRAEPTYVLTAVGPGGRLSAEVAVEVTGLPRVARFDVDPLVPVHVGEPIALGWDTVNATRVVIRQDGAVIVDTTTETSGRRTIALEETATFDLEASGSGEPATATTIAQVGARVRDFRSSEHVVRAGDEVEFSWVLEDADRAVIEGPGDWLYPIAAGSLGTGSVVRPIDLAGEFVLRAFRGEVPRTARVSVAITEEPRIRSLSVDPTTVTAAEDHPETVTLSWTQDGATSCTILANNSPVPLYADFACARTGTATIPVTATTTLKFVARNFAGDDTATVVVTAVPPARIESFFRTPNRRVAPGDQVTLSWDVADAVAVELRKNDVTVPIGATVFTGSWTDAVLVDTTYTLIALNSLGHPTNESLQVWVGPPVVLSAQADPDFLAIGESFTLSWVIDGGDSLAVTGPGPAVLHTTTDPAEIDEGSTRVLAPLVPGTHRYTVAATNRAGTGEAFVDVTASDGPMIRSLAATPLQLTLGQSFTLAWAVTNDAYGVTPTLALADDFGHTFPAIDSKNPNNGTLTITPTEEGRHVYTLTASTPGRMTHQKQVAVEISVPPLLHTFTATPDRVTTNGGQVVPNVELAWTSENGVELELFEAEPDGTVHPPAFHKVTAQAAIDAGSHLVHPTLTTWYLARLKNRIGATTSLLIRVVVDPPEVQSFTATPVEVAEGGAATLAWTTRNATHVTLLPPPSRRLGNTWVDVSALPGATKSTLVGDSAVATVPFPATFRFPFEGTNRASIQVSTNGWAGFDTGNTDSYGYTPTFPNTYGHVNFSVFGCDLDGNQNSPAGEIWYGTGTDAVGDFFAIQWKNWSWWSSSYRPSVLDFELVLRPTGSFEYRYGTMTAPTAARASGEGCTVGYQGTSNTRPWAMLVPYQTALAGGLQNTGFAVDVALPVNGSIAVTPSQTTTYTLTAKNADAETPAQATVTVWKNPAIVTARTEPVAPVATVPFQITWSTTNANGLRVLDGSGQVICAATDPVAVARGSCPHVEATPGLKSYTVEAVNGPIGAPVSTTTRAMSVTIFSYLAITSFDVSPTQFPHIGDTVTFSWTSGGAVEVQILKCPAGTLDPIACPDVTPPNAVPAAGSFTHVVTGSNEFWVKIFDPQWRSVQRMQGVYIDPASLDTLTATATQVAAGGSTTLTWTSTGATSVSSTPNLAMTDLTGAVPFIDLTGTGTAPTMDGSTDGGRYTVNFPAGFTFPWFGTNRTGLKTTTDGWITFNMSYASSDYSNSVLPDSTNPDLAIAPFWDDGERLSGAEFLWQLRQPAGGMKHLVLQWKNYKFYSTPTSELN